MKGETDSIIAKGGIGTMPDPKQSNVIQMPTRPNPNPTPEQVELFRLECLDEAGYFQPPDHLLGDVIVEPSVPDAPENPRICPNGCLLQWRMPATVSGFFNTDAMNFVDCEKCNQPAGKVCTDHRGRKLSQVHGERAEAYRKKFKDRVGLYKDGAVQIDKVREYNKKLLK
jgi:hypothetical protein